MREEATQSEEVLSRAAPLPVLSAGLRSRVMAAVVEAQENRRHSRRLIAGSLSVFAFLSWLSWRNPTVRTPHSQGPSVTAHDVPVSPLSGSVLGIMGSELEDDLALVEVQLRSRQDYFSRAQQM
jgi:hypothetical protein